MYLQMLRIFIAATLAFLQAPAFAQADGYPTRPVRLVLPFAPGGGTDVMARALNTKLQEVLKQSVIVDNRPGAGGIIATDIVAKAPGDGYTVLFTVSSHSINQALYAKLPFDTTRDLRGVTLIALLPQILAAHPSVPANNIQEFLELARKDAGYRNYGTGGVGSPGHFAGAILESMAKIQLTHVPYKGAGPAIADTIGNQVPYVLGTLAAAVPHVKSGKLKAIALTSKERSPLLPNVPTIAEGGFQGYDADTWVGTFVPRSTPDAVVSFLHQATLEALKDASVRERIDVNSGRIVGAGPQELDAKVQAEIAEFSKIVRERGIRAE